MPDRQTVPAVQLPELHVALFPVLKLPVSLHLPNGRHRRPGSAECAEGGTARCRRQQHGGDLSEADEKLLAALYALRKRLAAKQNVPAYMVFSDATLREMVQSKPLSMDEFLNITGVGEKKAARYGMAFLRAIEDMVGSRE